MAVEIVVEGADELIGKLTSLQKLNRVKSAISQEALFLVGKMKHYPVKVPFKNPMLYGKSEEAARIRRGFFYHLKHGEIQVPYARTQDLSKHWTTESSLDGFEARVGNNMAYGPLVQGDRQTKGHQGSGWLTDKEAVLVYGPQIQSRIIEAVEKEIAEF